MTSREINGKTYQLNDEQNLADPATWDRDFAEAYAKDLDIGPLTEGHWKVIEFMRADFQEKGASPSVRRITKASGVGTKELYTLFPGGPGKNASKIAGIPKPQGCI